MHVSERRKELAEEHWKWFKPWVERMRVPENSEEFVEAIGHAYRDAMIHGHKHGMDDAEEFGYVERTD